MMYYWLIVVFLLGLAVGSFLNVVIARLPRDKSLIWPGSHCGSCFQAIAWYDNLPLLSYLLLRGRCRSCGAGYSIRYFLVELLTGVLFAGLFYAEVICDIHQWSPSPPVLGLSGAHWAGFLFHAVLLSFLLAVSGCDMSGQREIPFFVPLVGTVVGLVGATLLPWPWPGTLAPRMKAFQLVIPEGIQAWPFWWPLPGGIAMGTWQMGLANGLAGMLAGSMMLRSISFIFAKGYKEGLGLGDADIMMMVGSFLGWQLVVVAFFVSVVPGLFLGTFQYVVRKDNSMPFGPSLAAGSMITCLCWRWIGPRLQDMFFWGPMMLVLAGFCATFLLIASLILRVIKR